MQGVSWAKIVWVAAFAVGLLGLFGIAVFGADPVLLVLVLICLAMIVT